MDIARRAQRRALPRILQPSACRRRLGDIPGAPPDVAGLMRLMGQDKKVRQGKLTFILARAIGEAFIAHDVAPERVSGFLAGEIAQAQAR